MPKPPVDLLIRGARELLACVPAGGNPLGRRSGVEIAVAGERIAAIGRPGELERDWDLSKARILDADGGIVAPGFIDCHTHLVFGGSRSAEYAARMTKSAAEVKALGIPTGIQATVAMTRAASFGGLVERAQATLWNMFRSGTTTVESKSGYGLSVDEELRMLEVNRALGTGKKQAPVDLVSTFLGAHDFPAGESRERYLESVVGEMLPRVAAAGLAEFCDVYCDDGYYTAAETRMILEAGIRAGLKPKLHVDAYSNVGGSAVAVELRAASADHLNYTTRAEMAAYAKAGVVGVVMPGLDFAVRHPRPFDARAMLEEGMTLALATDFCPACWIESMQTVVQLACRLHAFSPEEAILAATSGAAKALMLDDRGRVEAGALADLQIWNVPGYEDIAYRIGTNAVSVMVRRGVVWDFRGDAA